MQMTGTVRKAEGGIAYVVVKRQSACGENCGNCSGCKDKTNEVIAKNTMGALAGDSVVVSMESKKVLMAAFLFYIMPLIIFFCSYGIVYVLKLLELYCIIFALGIAFIYYILLYFYDKKNTDKYQHEIIKIN